MRRYIAKAAAAYGIEKSLGNKTVLTTEQVNELSSYLQSMEARLYGLTPTGVRRIVLVYKYCQENGISHNFNHETQVAGRKWFRQFMARHKELSVRTSEPVSIQRAIGFNEGKVNIFWNLLEKALFAVELGTRRIPPENVFNVDETGLTICNKPHKVVARRGKKVLVVN